ncbi:MAG: hypothetical protein ACYC6Y_25570, partial [Thermoguttaceae bacterium]
ALVALIWLVSRWSDRRASTNSSFGLFWALANAHQIRWTDRWILWRIARSQRLAEPALLFLDPRLTAPQANGRLHPQQLARLKAFRREAFAGIEQGGDGATEGAAATADRGPASEGKDLHRGTSAPEVSWSLAQPEELAEILNAMRAFSLQDQLLPDPRQQDEPAPEDAARAPSPTAEFAPSQPPVLDLYPWLRNDWEIGDGRR